MKVKINGKVKDVLLPKAFKAKWVTALKSGKFKQGQSQLVSKDFEGNESFCCIGVACRLVHPKFKSEAGLLSPANEYTGRISDLKVPKCLIGSMYGKYAEDYNPIVEKLATMNDGKYGVPSKSFKQIASWIDKNL